MAETTKVLGQLDCPAITLSDLYAVPAATRTVCSTLVVCNRTSANKTFRVSVAVAGVTDDVKQYLYYDVTVFKNDSFAATLGIAMGPLDKIRVYASATGLSFNLFGVEVT